MKNRFVSIGGALVLAAAVIAILWSLDEAADHILGSGEKTVMVR